MRRARLVILAFLLVAACSDSSDDGDSEGADTRETSTTVEETTSTSVDAAQVEADLEALADDAMEGRDNKTPGSELAQEHLIAQLEQFAEPLAGDFRHPFAEGTNVLATIQGGELAEEYVVLGAHYDGLGTTCRSSDPGDDICNGAGDNAAGVAAVLEIGRRIAAGEPPRRSVVLAFWDAEEDGLLGAADYVADPPVPLAQTTAYLNWDIQGVNLLPSLNRTTVIVGAETGGPALIEAAQRATQASDLEPLELSLLFGQGRSDHAVFAAAGVPTVFFTDANSACYHTAQDDLAALDLDKLAQQIDMGEALSRDLVETDELPAFVADAPVATYSDAESMLAVVSRAEPDIGRFEPADQATVRQFLTDLTAMVDAGSEAFDEAAIGTLLGGSATLVELLSQGECDAFLG